MQQNRTGNASLPGQMHLNRRSLLGGVHAGAEFIGEDDADAGAVFEGAELFEAFGLFEAAGRPGDELEEEAALEAVDAEVAVAAGPGLGIALVGQGAAAEVKRVAMRVEDDFDDVWIADLRGVLDGSGGGDHFDGGIIAQSAGEFVDEGRGDERFIALHVDDDAVIGEGLGGLGDAIRAAGVIGISKDGFGSERSGGLSDAGIIGGNDHVVDLCALLAALPDVLDEWFSGDEVKRLAGKAGGTPAGGDGDEGARGVGGGHGDRRKVRGRWNGAEGGARADLLDSP